MATLRNLKIKTSTCKRIIKELHSYEKQVEREAAKTADMKGKGADLYDLKHYLVFFATEIVIRFLADLTCKCIIKELHSYEKDGGILKILRNYYSH